MSASTLPYIRALDGLRALSVLLVVAFHARLSGNNAAGMVGVEIFFVLSGFLITRLLTHEMEQTGRVDWLRFQLRRLSRLYPVLLSFLAVVAVSKPWLSSHYSIGHEIALGAAYLSNFFRPLVGGKILLNHLWTLATEMQFYVVWPIIVIANYKLLGKQYWAGLMLVLFIAISWRLSLYLDLAPALEKLSFGSGRYIAGFAAGSLLAAFPNVAHRVGGPIATILAMIFVLFSFILPRSFALHNFGWYLLIVDACAVILVAACLRGEGVFFKYITHPIAVSLGVWSYGIYIWHYLPARLLRADFDGIPTFFMTLAITIPIAALSYRWFERPTRLRLNKRFDELISPSVTN